MDEHDKVQSLLEELTSTYVETEQNMQVFRTQNQQLVKDVQHSKNKLLKEILLVDLKPLMSNYISRTNSINEIENSAFIIFSCFENELKQTVTDVSIGLEAFLNKKFEYVSTRDLVIDIALAELILHIITSLNEVITMHTQSFIEYINLHLQSKDLAS